MNKETKQKTHSVKNRVFETIDQKKVTPRPRWEFLLKRSVVWLAGVASVVVGGLAVAAALFSFVHSGFQYRVATHQSGLSFFIDTLPYLWIVALVVFSGIAYYNIRHTEGGYRYPLTVLVSFSILGSVALGGLFYTLGFGGIIDEKAKRFVPFHRPVVQQQQQLWQNPEEGRLAGSVVSYDPVDSVLIFKSFDGREWRVLTSDLREFDFEAIEMFDTVRIVGLSTTSPNTIHACFILPWELRIPGRDATSFPESRPMFGENERNIQTERSNECRDVRPYQNLKKLQTN